MPAKSPARRRAAALVAAIERHHGPDHPHLSHARRQLHAAELEEHVRRLVDAVPSLDGEQRDRIAALLRAPATPRHTERRPAEGVADVVA